MCDTLKKELKYNMMQVNMYYSDLLNSFVFNKTSNEPDKSYCKGINNDGRKRINSAQFDFYESVYSIIKTNEYDEKKINTLFQIMDNISRFHDSSQRFTATDSIILETMLMEIYDILYK
jgi:hypothetical protein